ncbi:hypothetical protein L207DRAFT_531949 [Hyaloscypha variabilis F]|uniref:Uncharacterized protein n=1 Tax=Hyaloscypha variabilis (strain UAMH 11265 / GT02V1 / F) TaxID=1149755 RepID=A0A2J6RGN7_HYAVF|nr:hypothetical protein L207DRAFT_531949 [Hyaloscypha variabilis F]
MLTTNITPLALLPLATQANFLNLYSPIQNPSTTDFQPISDTYTTYANPYNQATPSSPMLETPTTTDTGSAFFPAITSTTTALPSTSTIIESAPSQTSVGVLRITNSSVAGRRVESGRMEGWGVLAVMVGVGMWV